MAMFNGWRITRTGIIFVAGLVILAGLVFGGVYWVSQRGEQARREEAIAVAEQNLQEQSPPISQDDESDETANDDVVTTPGTTDNETENEDNPTALPETGAELTSLLAVVLLAAAGSYYLQSRRLLRNL